MAACAAALTRLSAATGATIDKGIIDVYLENRSIQQFSTAVIVTACRELEDTSEWFPKLVELKRYCERVEIRLARAARPQLPEPEKPKQDIDRLLNFMKQTRAELRKKRMKR